MKRILITLSLGIASIAALSNGAYAQNSEHPVAFNDVNFKSSVRNLAFLESPAFMGTYIPDATKVNTKAIKDFQARFNTANNNMWFEDKAGFVSYFVQNGYGDRAFYDKKGHWEYSLIFYGEDRLPHDIRAAVKSVYYDFAITLVEEVQTPDALVYVVHLEDKSNLKIVKINRDGEMQTMQELTKE
jgi:hypothetical protein